MLSDAARDRIQHMQLYTGHPADHERAVAAITALIEFGDITHCDDAREFTAEQGWSHDEQDELSRTIDDVGYTLMALGRISRW